MVDDLEKLLEKSQWTMERASFLLLVFDTEGA